MELYIIFPFRQGKQRRILDEKVIVEEELLWRYWEENHSKGSYTVCLKFLVDGDEGNVDQTRGGGPTVETKYFLWNVVIIVINANSSCNFSHHSNIVTKILRLNSLRFSHDKIVGVSRLILKVKINCCGASGASEQHYKQDLKRIFRREFEFSNSSLFTRMHCI